MGLLDLFVFIVRKGMAFEAKQQPWKRQVPGHAFFKPGVPGLDSFQKVRSRSDSERQTLPRLV